MPLINNDLKIVEFFRKNFKEVENKLRKKRIVIIYGGFSEERGTSIESGSSVYKELKKNGFKTIKIDPSQRNFIPLLNKKVDLVFNCLHGSFGESGHLPAILDYLKVPYTFSGVYASAVTMDKIYFKSIAKKLGFNCPLDNLDKDKLSKKQTRFIYKKIRGGSSKGMRIVDTIRPKNGCFVEEFVDGNFLTMGIFEQKGSFYPLGIVSFIAREREFYDEAAKYQGLYKYSKYSGANAEKIREISIKVSDFLDIKGAARLDFIEKDSQLFLLEINSVPGIYPKSNLACSARLANFSYYELLVWILNNAGYSKL
ncbi:MAG: ATP-grasp domain-containing protein [Candidatus Moranbacteria bacterium]|nr:ATP-grasp domain-containing protein [Candidatus Moranbacteria bacterium]